MLFYSLPLHRQSKQLTSEAAKTLKKICKEKQKISQKNGQDLRSRIRREKNCCLHEEADVKLTEMKRIFKIRFFLAMIIMLAMIGCKKEDKMTVKKSGKDYDITITEKVENEYDFSMTYKGTIHAERPAWM